MVIRTIVVCLAAALAAACAGDPPRPARSAAASEDLPGACRPALAPLAGDGELGSQIATLQARATEGPLAEIAVEQLGFALVARARLSGDDGLYDQALAAASCLEGRQPANHQARLLRGHVYHQQHRFREAEAIARTLVAVRGSALDHGLLGDALMEQGQLTEAAGAYQRMIDLKPYYQSYTRAGHVRWLKGDLDGAISMLRLATAAASPRDPEAGPWARARLAFLELQAGRIERARAECTLALEARPDYAPALVVLGRIALVDGRVADAVEVLTRAVEAHALPESEWLLADALRAAGRRDDATRREGELARSGRLRDPRTVALFLATRGDTPADAVRLAMRELERRADVHTADAVAWALASAGRIDDARPYMARALAEGTSDARLFLHAGIIELAAGDRVQGRRWLARARQLERMLLPSEREWLADPTTRARRLSRAL